MCFTQEQCPICGYANALEDTVNGGDDYIYDCGNCGRYCIPVPCARVYAQDGGDEDIANDLKNRDFDEYPVFTFKCSDESRPTLASEFFYDLKKGRPTKQ